MSFSNRLRRQLTALSIPIALLLLYASLGGVAAGIFPAALPPVVAIDVDGPIQIPVPPANQTLERRIGVAFDQPYAQLKNPDGTPLYPSQPPDVLDLGFDGYPPAVAARGAGLRWVRVAADVLAFAQCDGATLRWSEGAFAEYRALYRRAFAAQVRLEVVINQARRSAPCLPLLGQGGSIAPYLAFIQALAQQNKEVRAEFRADPANATATQPLTYQIFNEPNNGGEPILGRDPELFARLVYEATLAVRAVDPEAQVVSGGFGGGETKGRGAIIDIKEYVSRFIAAYRALLPAGALAARQTPGLADAIGYNPYGDQNNIAWLRAQLDAAGFAALPIDAAEWGIHNDDSNSDAIANSLDASEDLRLLSVFLMNTLEKPVRNITIWTLRRSYLEPDKRRTAGLVAPVEHGVDTPNQTDISCAEAGPYSNIPGIGGYFCRPKMYAVSTLMRVSEDRKLVGSLLATPNGQGQLDPGNNGVHAIKFEGGGPYGLDDVIAVWCPQTDSDGCVFQFSKPPIAALDRVGRWIEHDLDYFATSELEGVHYFFFSHPAPTPGPTFDVPPTATGLATPQATPRSTPFPTAIPTQTPFAPPPGLVCPTYLSCVYLPSVRHRQ